MDHKVVPRLYNNNYIYVNDTIDIKCMTCFKYYMNYTPYHYKFVLMICVLLVPDKCIPDFIRNLYHRNLYHIIILDMCQTNARRKLAEIYTTLPLWTCAENTFKKIFSRDFLPKYAVKNIQ